MSDIFTGDEDDLIVNDEFENTEDEVVSNTPVKNENAMLDARRRLENLLEEKRLREELGDFEDFDD